MFIQYMIDCIHLSMVYIIIFYVRALLYIIIYVHAKARTIRKEFSQRKWVGCGAKIAGNSRIDDSSIHKTIIQYNMVYIQTIISRSTKTPSFDDLDVHAER